MPSPGKNPADVPGLGIVIVKHCDYMGLLITLNYPYNSSISFSIFQSVQIPYTKIRTSDIGWLHKYCSLMPKYEGNIERCAIQPVQQTLRRRV